MVSDLDQAAEPESVARLKVIDWEASLLLADHDGIHNMHGFRWGIKTALDNAMNGIYGNDSFNSMRNVDYLIRSMRQCDALGRWPSRAERLEERDIKQWGDVGL